MTTLTERAKALHDTAAAFAAEVRTHAEKRGTREAWEAWRSAHDALYDLWGAFGALGLDEKGGEDAVAILACRPVTLDMNDPLEAVFAELTIYSDSIEDACSACGRAVLLAPRMRAVRDSPTESIVLCMKCAVLLGQLDGGISPGDVIHLGNPEGRKA